MQKPPPDTRCGGTLSRWEEVCSLGDVRPQNNRILAAIASRLDIYTCDGLMVHCDILPVMPLQYYVALHLASQVSPLSRGVWHCITHYITHTQTSLWHSVTEDMTCHDTGDSFTRSQGVQYVQCTVQLPVSGLTPGVHMYSLHRQVLVLAHQAQSVQASPGWHRSHIGVMWPLTSWWWVMLHCYKNKQLVIAC